MAKQLKTSATHPDEQPGDEYIKPLKKGDRVTVQGLPEWNYGNIVDIKNKHAFVKLKQSGYTIPYELRLLTRLELSESDI